MRSSSVHTVGKMVRHSAAYSIEISRIMDLSTILLALISVALLIVLIRLFTVNSSTDALDKISAHLAKQEMAVVQQQESARAQLDRVMQAQRQELSEKLALHSREAQEQQHKFAQATLQQLTGFEQRLATLQTDLNQRFEHLRETVGQQLEKAQAMDREGRAEQTNALAKFRSELNDSLQNLSKASTEKLEQVRGTVEKQLQSLQTDNAQKLEKMRETVDEKLQSTLNTRLDASFKIVSERLEQVHKGLGEMQQLASGVGDLKRVLTNVKTRGTWGEVQLGALLEQILAPEQYQTNVATKPKSSERVEFAICLPGRDADSPVFLPIDAKFPSEDYQRLVDAQERADVAGVEEAGKALDNRLKIEAKTIRDKYVSPPDTTDFAVMYLPTEGLYAEALRRPQLAEFLQREYRITIAGPTTLAAMLNSLQMGFRTLAIEKRSSEVWQVLGAVKTEFGKFGDVLAKTKKKLQETVNTIDTAEVRTRAISRKLKDVEALSSGDSQALLDMPEEGDTDPEAMEKENTESR